MALVTVGVVTWNSSAFIETCLDAVRAQTHAPIELLVADNASADGTRARLDALVPSASRIDFPANRGFSAAHNALIRRGRGEFYLAVNPDVTLDARFIARLHDALVQQPHAGSASGKLLRDGSPAIIDSTGIVMLPSQRHVDRGAGEPDHGQFARTEEVFGTSGAAGFYRRSMLDDVCIGGEYFDEDFFAYREDADLAWRAQLLGWRCVYVPDAVATHVRRVTPERRGDLPPEINRYSVRNRFLLRINNQTLWHLARFFGPALWRDAQVAGYVLLKERSSMGAFIDLARLLPKALARRREIMARRRAPSRDVAWWFVRGHDARPLATPARRADPASA